MTKKPRQSKVKGYWESQKASGTEYGPKNKIINMPTPAYNKLKRFPPSSNKKNKVRFPSQGVHRGKDGLRLRKTKSSTGPAATAVANLMAIPFRNSAIAKILKKK